MLDTLIFVFGLIAIGFFASRSKLLPPSAYQNLNDYVYFVAMPALIFSKLSYYAIEEKHLILLLANILPIAIVILCIITLWKLKFLSSNTAAILLTTSFFGNIVFMGFPIVEMRFGPQALAEASLISFAYNVMMFLPAMILILAITSKRDFGFIKSKILTNTVILSCLAGLLASLLSFSFPNPLSQILSSIGSTTAPVALFSLGLFLSSHKLGNLQSAFALSLIKLVAFPLLFMATSYFIGFEGEFYKISLLEAMMPVAVTNFIIASKFGLDEKLVASSILISTPLSIITLSLL